jgi:hypothetical protein
MATSVRYTVLNGEVIAEKRGATRSFYTPDPLGSTVALFNASQTKTDSWVYWPYGEVKTRTGTTATPYQFVGTYGYAQFNDRLTYGKQRWLDVEKGRWLSAFLSSAPRPRLSSYLFDPMQKRVRPPQRRPKPSPKDRELGNYCGKYRKQAVELFHDFCDPLKDKS